MPRRLLSFGEWSAHKVAWKDVKCGDLLFVKNKERPKLIAHIALVLNSNQIFHCCSALGAVIESKEQFFSVYEQKLPFEKMPLYIDPRNKPLREKHQGLFIDF